MKAILALTLLVATTRVAAAQPTPADRPSAHVRGTISTVDAGGITVATAAGRVRVRVDDATRIVRVVPTTVTEIGAGSFIGSVNEPVPSSTSANALEVTVFPPSMAGVSEGDFAWDPPSGSRAARLTNGTVMGVNRRHATFLTVQYMGSSKLIRVAPGTPVVRIEPAPRNALEIGDHVVAVPGRDGGAARYVAVGERGFVPPM